MRRWIAVLWHASFFVIAGALYFFFVLPRWFELTGEWPAGLGLPMRLLCGALFGLAALPVVLTLLRTRRPEIGTPRLALSLRFWSIVLHVLAGALIVGAAISEIWVSLDAAGPTLFAVYGAAAAIALLGALSFYLAYAAELPPPPPKPLRPKSQTRRRGRRSEGDDEETDATEDVDAIEPDEPATEAESLEAEPVETESDDVVEPVTLEKTDEPAEAEATPEPTLPTETAEPAETAVTDETAEPTETAVPAVTDGAKPDGLGNADPSDADEPDSKLRNRRPNGKSSTRLFGRSRRGVALDD